MGTVSLDRRRRIRSQSAKARKRARAQAKVRAEVFARDGGRCRLEAVVGAYCTDGLHDVPPCFGPLTPHHVDKAGQGGPDDVDNEVALCAGHNEWVERDRDAAVALGLARPAKADLRHVVIEDES